jgi:hypothetical protein
MKKRMPQGKQENGQGLLWPSQPLVISKRTGKNQYTGPLPNRDGAVRRVLAQYLFNAKKRKLIFALSFEEFKELISKNCFWCGDPPFQIIRIRWKSKDEYKEQPPFFYTGIDRLDNAVGYLVGNCAPCCKVCNAMRSDMTIEAFLAKIRKIAARMAAKHG